MNDDRVYLQHNRDAIQDIENYTRPGRDVFLGDRMRQDATVRKLEVIGQAVNNLSDGRKSREPLIPWKQIAGLRDKVMHEYVGVNLELVSKARTIRTVVTEARSWGHPESNAG